jgi:hypothetical protein
MKLTRPDVLIFFHIGKTGGSTLGRILTRRLPPECIFDANIGQTRSALGLRRRADIDAAYRSLPDDRQREIRMVGGHVPFGIHELFDRAAESDRRCMYITLVRHPVDRVVSSFYYLRQQPGIPISPMLQNFDINGYIDSRLGLDPYDYQVRVLSGCPTLDAEWTDLAPLEADAVTEAHLERVKQNIERLFLFAGTTERFDEALLILRRLYGWKFSDVLFTRENVTPGRPRLADLPDETIQKIRRHNTHDLSLYDWVDQRFSRLVRSLGARFQAEVRAFKYLNRRFQKYGMTPGLRRALALSDRTFT